MMIDFKRRKKIGWLALATGAGGSVAFGALCLLQGSPHPLDLVYLWPFLSLVSLVVSALMLRRYYRLEPESFAGFWHLALVDLVAVAFLTALAMTAWRAAWPESFVPAGAIVIVTLAVGLTLCLLIAARQGFSRPAVKWLQAAGILMTSLGWMSIGTIVLLTIVMLIYDWGTELTREFFGDLFLSRHIWSDESQWLFHALRVGLLCLPAGLIIGRIVSSFFPQKAEVAAKT